MPMISAVRVTLAVSSNAANTRNVSDGSAAFPEYLVKAIAGIRIGILGLTTPNIPNWEPARNRPGLRWEDPVETADPRSDLALDRSRHRNHRFRHRTRLTAEVTVG